MVWNDASQNNLLTELLPPPKKRLTNTEKLLSSLYMEISSKIPLATGRVQLWQSHCTLNCLFLKFPAPQGKWSPERQSQIMADVKVNGFGRDYSLSIRINQRHSLKGKKDLTCCLWKGLMHIQSCAAPQPSLPWSCQLFPPCVALEQPQFLLYFSLCMGPWLKAKWRILSNYPSGFSAEDALTAVKALGIKINICVFLEV